MCILFCDSASFLTFALLGSCHGIEQFLTWFEMTISMGDSESLVIN